jgi:hypothetical protein
MPQVAVASSTTEAAFAHTCLDALVVAEGKYSRSDSLSHLENLTPTYTYTPLECFRIFCLFSKEVMTVHTIDQTLYMSLSLSALLQMTRG